ncbi:MAG: chitodextrinase [Patiriisocius sp.]|jgi:chitodextrinase
MKKSLLTLKNQIAFIAIMLCASLAIAQNTNESSAPADYTPSENPTLILTPTNFFVSPPVRDLPVCDDLSTFDGFIVPKDGANTSHDLSDKRKRKLAALNAAGASSSSIDPKMQLDIAPAQSNLNRAPIVSFDDVSNQSAPPDPSMAVGPNHVVTMQNGVWAVYDKSGNIAAGFPKTLNDPLSGPNHSDNAGDPVVMYDREADRWFISQFQLSGNQSLSDNVFLVGISTTPDPTGAYNVYEYELGAGNDYPHYGIWGDTYVTAGNFTGAQKVYTFNRNKMLAGDATAEIAGFSPANLSTGGFAAPIPVHSEAAGAATGDIKIVFYQDDAFSGVNSDHIGLWNIDMDWTNATTINNSTISNKVEIPTAAFDAAIAGGFANIAQPGTNQRIDAIVGAVMNMSHWYKFPTHESILLNWVVEIQDGTQKSGIRWVELRSTNGGNTWSVYQEGTFTDPAATTVAQKESVFMGCISMDSLGNIGLGYTKSGTNTFPSLYYTGRMNGDPLGTMTVPEELAVAGTTSVTSNDRYGDYGQGVRDPSDDLTFWVTSEYSGDPGFNRKSRVYSYKLQAGPPDTEVPTDPTNLIASSITSNAATLNWNASTDNVSVAQYTVSVDGTVVGTTGNTNFDLTGLSPLTAYSASVSAQDAAGNSSGEATTSFITLDGPSVSYCDSASTNTNDEYISNVTLNTINNSSGAQFYSDFTAISTDLSEGQSYTLTVTPTWTGTVYSEGYAAWIDYNNDGDFDDSGELVWSKAPSTDSPSSGNFTVPNGTSGDAVRLRVAMKYNGVPTSCETFTYGEVEDYSVNLGAATGGDTQAPSTPLNLSASNETTTTVDLSWSSSSDNVGVTGYELYLDGSSIGNVASTSATVTGLLENTTYAFNVRAFDAAGNNSALSNTATATTTGGGGAGVIAGYYFETGLEGWLDGGSDCVRFASSTRAFEGTYSIRIRDNSNSSNARSPILDLSGNNQITIEFHTYARSMEVGENFLVEFFNGSSYQVIGNYARGTDFNNNSFFTDTIVLDSGTYNFNSNNRFRFRNDASNNNDQIYFDQVIVSGDNAVARQPSPTVIDTGENEANFKSITVGNIRLYPNPADAVLNIDILEGTFERIDVYSVTGSLVRTISEVSNRMSLEVSTLSSGIYFVRFSSNGFVITKRFVKK